MATQVFYQVLNLSVLMALGFFLRKKVFSGDFFKHLNTFIASVTLPALAFAKLQVKADSSIYPSLITIFFLALAWVFLSFFFGLFLFRKEPIQRKKVLTHLVLFSNSAFIGFPIISAAFGEEALIYGVIYVAAFNITTWTLGVYVFAGKESLSIKKLFFNPTLIASFLGLAFFLLAIPLPSFPLDALEMVGQTTTPLSMLVIGAQLTTLSFSSLKDPGLFLATGVRLLFIPLAFFLLFKWIPLPPMVFEIFFVMLAMPSAAVTSIQALQYKGDEALAAKGVALTTLCSIVTIPVLTLLL